MIDKSIRLFRVLILILAGLFFEFIAFSLISAFVFPFFSEQEHQFESFIFSIEFWFISVVYRTVFMHLFASWKLKIFLINKCKPTSIILLADFVLAVFWVGVLTLLFPPAKIFFNNILLWAPVFISISFGTLLFLSIFRKKLSQ